MDTLPSKPSKTKILTSTLQKTNAAAQELRREFVKQLATLATSGFGVVAALAWNNVIQEFVNTYIKPYLSKGSGLVSLFLYAIGVTLLAVLVTLQLTKLADRLSKK